jgi:hypothetical protein
VTIYTGNQIYRRALALTDRMAAEGSISSGADDANDALGRLAIRSLVRAGTVTMDLNTLGCAVYRLVDGRDAPASARETDLQ